MSFETRVQKGTADFDGHRSDMLELIEKLRNLEARAMSASEKRAERMS